MDKEFVKITNNIYIDQNYNSYTVMSREELEEELRKTLTIIPNDEE